jgi:hypothetical protein
MRRLSSCTPVLLGLLMCLGFVEGFWLRRTVLLEQRRCCLLGRQIYNVRKDHIFLLDLELWIVSRTLQIELPRKLDMTEVESSTLSGMLPANVVGYDTKNAPKPSFRNTDAAQPKTER